jgi:hypothetical protein
VNGAASVLGSVGAVALAMAAGFNLTLLVAAALYLVGLGFVRWAAAAPAEAAEGGGETAR